MSTSASQPAPIRFERRYENTDVQDLWDLWATPDGFAAWWGPDGFHVDVHKFELREGGELVYDMVAHAPQEVAAMKQMNMPVAHATRGRFSRVVPLKIIDIVHSIDFIPGVEPYENLIHVEFSQSGTTAQMLIEVAPHQHAEWTRMAKQGMESQLTKVPDALRTRSRGK